MPLEVVVVIVCSITAVNNNHPKIRIVIPDLIRNLISSPSPWTLTASGPPKGGIEKLLYRAAFLPMEAGRFRLSEGGD